MVRKNSCTVGSCLSSSTGLIINKSGYIMAGGMWNTGCFVIVIVAACRLYTSGIQMSRYDTWFFATGTTDGFMCRWLSRRGCDILLILDYNALSAAMQAFNPTI